MGLAEVVFAVVCILAIGGLVRGQVAASRALRSSRARAARVAGADPVQVAWEAVQCERERLTREISAGFGASLDAVAEATALARCRLQSGADPAEGLAAIHLEARRATSELRRQLGLLRPADAGRPEPDVQRPPSGPTAPGLTTAGSGRLLSRHRGWSFSRADLWLALGTVGLAGLESVSQARVATSDVDRVAVALTVCAAASVLLRRVAPGVAGSWLSGVYVASVLLGQAVPGGFWMIVTLGTVLWAIVQHSSGADGTAVAGLLVVLSSTTSTWVLDRENTVAAVVLVLVVVVASLVRRATAGREQVSVAAIAEHQLRVTRAAEEAARLERLSLARDLHDVVSHTIAMVAIQASAAAVSWRPDPGAALAALDVIDDGVRRARVELMHTAAAAPTPSTGETHVAGVIERARRAGVEVRFRGPQRLVGAQAPVVHRVLQEAITNVLRHAPGARVAVTVSRRGEGIEVTVEDDGPGMSPSAVPGFGLIGLRERVELAGGTIRLGPGADGGHRVDAWLPALAAAPVRGGRHS